jgi:hypothetical protein
MNSTCLALVTAMAFRVISQEHKNGFGPLHCSVYPWRERPANSSVVFKQPDVQKFGFPPVRVEALTVFSGFLAFFRSADTDAAPIQRYGAAFPRYVLGSQNRFVSLRVSRFIGKMVGKRTQGFYIDRATVPLKNINGFLQRAQCRCDLRDIACG